jgi:ribokinase
MRAIQVVNGRYRALIGVGGIGSGVFFALTDNHTLGREESRGGRFLDQRDYCKLHIIAHYVKTLLGSEFATILIGKVGDDQAGRILLAEMEEAGLDSRYVAVAPGEQTLFSTCFIYPDGSGGNLTTEDSANARVNAAYVAQAEPEFQRFSGQGVALAAPEAPMAARLKLLELGTTYRFWRVLSLTTAETRSPLLREMLSQTDLLAVNLDEAAALAGRSVIAEPAESIVKVIINKLRRLKADMCVSITAGKRGSWAWDGIRLTYQAALPAEVASTAGAGDAHLAGIIAGLVAGLDMAQAQELGTLVAALSVTSPHTINPDIERASLQAFAAGAATSLSDAVKRLLAD